MGALGQDNLGFSGDVGAKPKTVSCRGGGGKTKEINEQKKKEKKP